MAAEFAKFTPEEERAVRRIIDRALPIYREALGPHNTPTALTLRMNLSATHRTTPLRLTELAETDDANLMHDVGGIARYLNRETGELENCFLPRFAARQG